jgi:hypothetical protein
MRRRVRMTGAMRMRRGGSGMRGAVERKGKALIILHV